MVLSSKVRMGTVPRKVAVIAVVCLWSVCADVNGGSRVAGMGGLGYDGRSLIINGKRELLFSGSIHYPRSPPEMWPDILNKARHGGLNVIQTYVFWNRHEPVQGQFNFEGNNDVVKFIKLIGQNGMYVTLRVGPFIEAEWNFGGFPCWLRDVANVTFRTDNPPFKYHMKRFIKMIIDMMSKEKLFSSQGGPIILAQVENEYNSVQLVFRDAGTRYVQWAANMAIGFKTGIPWVMCKQMDAPDPVINTCNGRNCGDTFTGPNKPYKPVLWTENWTAQYRVYGDPPSQRSAEDLAFSIARFVSKNGTLANYYMYYGGTNFGRTGSAFVTTRYYDEAPLDEYGFQREPKWGHLRDLHSALRLSKRALLWGVNYVQMLGDDIEARVYEQPGTKSCAAFLLNNNTRIPTTTKFKGSTYYLPQHSISILPDCKTVVFNTQMVVAQHNIRSHTKSVRANKNLQWEMSQDDVPTFEECPIKSQIPQELITVTKDTTDYLWYTTTIDLMRTDLPFRKGLVPVIQIANMGHVMHTFVNGEYVGSAHGNKVENSFVFSKPVNLKIGPNQIALLCATVGLPDNGAYLEHRLAGLHSVVIQGLNIGSLDLSRNGWGHKIGLNGEKLHLFTQGGSHRVQWSKAKGTGMPITWYKAYFDAPEGDGPVALELGTMAKGIAWVNGKSIGRYWISFLSPLGKPTQSTYHVPRAFLRPTDNLLVIFDETGGNPNGIEILNVDRDKICSIVSENYPADVSSWKRDNNDVLHTVARDLKPKAQLHCPDNKKILRVEFASFGNPIGSCGDFIPGSCSAPSSKKVVEKYCLGKNSCSVPVEAEEFGKDGFSCSGIVKALAVQVQCGT